MKKVKIILVTMLASSIYGCNAVPGRPLFSGTPDLHFILEASPKLHESFERTFQSYPSERKRLSDCKEKYSKIEKEVKVNNEDLYRIKSKIDYSERTLGELERSTSDNLRKYEGVKKSLDELESSLDGLMDEIIKPSLENKR